MFMCNERFVGAVTALTFGWIGAAAATDSFTASVWGLEIPVDDVKAATTFYTTALGFEAGGAIGPSTALLSNGKVQVLLTLTDSPIVGGDGAEDHDESGAYLNLRVHSLDRAVEVARNAGATVLDDTPGRAAIGSYVRIRDPFGNPAHLIDVDNDDIAADSGPQIYNLGVHVDNMAAAESFYVSAGFEVLTRDYLPETLVLTPVGAAMVVIHPDSTQKTTPSHARPVLVLHTPDLKTAVAQLTAAGSSIETTHTPAWNAPTAVMRDPSGSAIRIIEPRTSGTPGSPVATGIDDAMAAQLFDQFKALAGDWRGASTKGWVDVERIQPIAAGSAVMIETDFGGDPEQNMVTMVHLDEGRLLLTHYCVAQNQPRLIATGVEQDGRVVHFEFLDGTGMTTRNTGHMDKAIYRFVDDDHYTSRWTFYSNGTESWMEEITYQRLVAD